MAVVELEVVGAPLEPGADEVSRRRGSCAGGGGGGRLVPFPQQPCKAGLSPSPRSPHSWAEPPAPGRVYLSQPTSDSGVGLSLKQTPVSRPGSPGKGPGRLWSDFVPLMVQIKGSCGGESRSPYQGMKLPRVYYSVSPGDSLKRPGVQFPSVPRPAKSPN